MSTCKFYKVDQGWHYKVRPGFDEGQPVTKEILFKAFGVTGMYKTVVTVPDSKRGEFVITIEDGTIKDAEIENLRFVPVDLTEFVVRLPERQEMETDIAN